MLTPLVETLAAERALRSVDDSRLEAERAVPDEYRSNDRTSVDADASWRRRVCSVETITEHDP